MYIKKKTTKENRQRKTRLLRQREQANILPRAETASRVVVSSNQNSMLTKAAVKANSMQCSDGRPHSKHCKCKADGAIQFREYFTSGGTYRLHLLLQPPRQDGQLQRGGGALAVPCCPDLVYDLEAA